MMGLYRSISGAIQVSVMSADIPGCLQTLEQEQIALFSIRAADPVTLVLTVSRKDFKKLQQVCERKGYVLQIMKRKGLFWPLHALLKRPVLVTGMVILIILAACLPGRILFISTEGNESVPSRFILEQAEACGLKFWSVRRDIRSERVKNALLESVPKLQWVGVNTYGCRAVITVRERSAEPEEADTASVSHIVAARDGVIRACTATRGNLSCAPGQAVRKGDILISGYTDCGHCYIAERAEGKIQAQTQRSIRAVMLPNCKIQSASGHADSRFALLIGKKRINFYKGSGISRTTCDKMYSKYVLTLPGSFALPVVLLKESTISCYLTESVVTGSDKLLKSFAADYLSRQMTDGAILRRSEVLSEVDGLVRLDGVYDCLEEIGTVQDEKIGDFNGKTDGADRERRSGG